MTLHMTDSIRLRKRNRDGVSDYVIANVFCTETVGVQSERVGFNGSGQLTVRLPKTVETDIRCGDQICREGSAVWYTVAEICDNRRAGSGLSHWKIVGRR